MPRRHRSNRSTGTCTCPPDSPARGVRCLSQSRRAGFTCNRQKLTEFRALWAYARDLFRTHGFGDSIDLPQITEHYYVVHKDIDTTQVLHCGPDSPTG